MLVPMDATAIPASTVAGLGVASTAIRCAPPTRSATEVAAPTRSPRDREMSPIRTASPISAPDATAAGFRDASSTV